MQCEDHGNDSARQRAGHASETLLILVGRIDACVTGRTVQGCGLTVALRRARTRFTILLIWRKSLARRPCFFIRS